ncbi:glycosyltransferase family 2 protein [Patescibacteria group bacterium]|nr:glycosyltransferase family 2 protein [Patescibacteria group bacterium]MCG2702535.1 glycosyltransferase family 2 protein [Candidatus Parcubacteria bacterium]MBU4265113.1 glycosyltransferase family 2 protein [Patescibacteria group bacterium]MBU4390677.1 glycosyltransferase family 2 protein [Patescibacteria group bacterium]MBU4397468.1 glycosyltransferase family 2 protein [Patescibacteria group bacterium]
MAKTLSIVIPCYNESKTILEILKKAQKANSLGLKKEIIIIDDGSTDGTREILKKIRKRKELKIVFHQKNTGKGSALKTGFKKSSGDIVLIQDADLEYDPSEYPMLLKPILDGKADVVYGSRFMGGKPHRVVYYWHSLVNKTLTTFSNMLTNINLTDMETCYKVFSGPIIRKIALQLQSNRFGFEPEITARLTKIKGIRFYEVGISYYGRTYEEGKHINWIDGLKTIYQIIKYNV